MRRLSALVLNQPLNGDPYDNGIGHRPSARVARLLAQLAIDRGLHPALGPLDLAPKPHRRNCSDHRGCCWGNERLLDVRPDGLCEVARVAPYSPVDTAGHLLCHIVETWGIAPMAKANHLGRADHHPDLACLRLH